jgi:hypothetical protein
MSDPSKPTNVTNATNSTNDASDFASQATQTDESSLVGEFVEFLRDNKKWWLAPIVISVLGLGLLVLLGGSAAAPFIYTLF